MTCYKPNKMYEMNLNDKGLVTKIYKELLQINKKEVNILLEKNMNRRQFTNKPKQLINTRNYAQLTLNQRKGKKTKVLFNITRLTKIKIPDISKCKES